jgi:hypothetical protein
LRETILANFLPDPHSHHLSSLLGIGKEGLLLPRELQDTNEFKVVRRRNRGLHNPFFFRSLAGRIKEVLVRNHCGQALALVKGRKTTKSFLSTTGLAR